MGPVSFERVGDGFSRDALLRLAARLRAADIQPQIVHGDTVMLVRSRDAERAAAIAAEVAAEFAD